MFNKKVGKKYLCDLDMFKNLIAISDFPIKNLDYHMDDAGLNYDLEVCRLVKFVEGNYVRFPIYKETAAFQPNQDEFCSSPTVRKGMLKKERLIIDGMKIPIWKVVEC